MIAHTRTLFAAVALCTLLAVPSVARATTLERLTIADMSRRATTVVVGTVVSTSSEARFGGIVTAVRVKVAEPLKGIAIGVTTVYVPGGTLPDGTTEVIDGMSAFAPGESVAVFADGLGWVMGGHQGKVRIVRGLIAATGQPATALSSAVRSTLGASRSASAAAPFMDLTGVLPQEAPVTAAGGPSISGIGPGNVGAGIGATITITGSGFGSTRGTVSFFYRSGQPRIPATVIASWTDTRIVCEVPVGTVDGYSASAGSDPVIVTTAAGTASPGFDLSIAFGNGKRRWAKNSATYPTTRVTYRVYPGGVAQAEALVDAAASTWNGAGADFGLVDGGRFSGAPGDDDTNDVAWASGLPSGVIAQAGSYTSNGSIVECNVTFSTAYSWGDGSGNTMDIQSIAEHELGHWLFLRDMYGDGDRSKVMYGFGSNDQVKRVLASGDLAGIVWIYGSAPKFSDTVAPTTTSDAKASYLGQATIRLTATDNAGGSGVAHTRYVVDSQPEAEGATVTVSPAGWHTVAFWSVDASGNVETPAKTVGFTITYPDTTAPVTTSDAAGDYSDAARIQLTAIDAGSGVAATYYELDDGTRTAGTSITTSMLGDHVLRFWSVDRDGNTEQPNEARFTVANYDLFPPDTASEVATSYVGVATIRFVATDDRSGVAATHYKVDDGPEATGTQVIVSTTGTHTVEYWSVDGAGNPEARKKATFTIGALPKSTLSTPSAPSSVVHRRLFTIKGSVTPHVTPGAIVKVYLYHHESGHWKLRKTVNVRVAYSMYSVRTYLSTKGRWRIRSYHADAGHASSYSAYRYLTIR